MSEISFHIFKTITARKLKCLKSVWIWLFPLVNYVSNIFLKLWVKAKYQEPSYMKVWPDAQRHLWSWTFSKSHDRLKSYNQVEWRISHSLTLPSGENSSFICTFFLYVDHDFWFVHQFQWVYSSGEGSATNWATPVY